MKEFIQNQRAFMSKASKLLKEEDAEAILKAFEEQEEAITAFEKSFDEAEEDKEELEKKTQEDEAEVEKERVEKYAELFANASDLKELLEQFKEAQETIQKTEALNTALVERVEKLEKAKGESKQPQDPITKGATEEELDDARAGNALLGR